MAVGQDLNKSYVFILFPFLPSSRFYCLPLFFKERCYEQSYSCFLFSIMYIGAESPTNRRLFCLYAGRIVASDRAEPP